MKRILSFILASLCIPMALKAQETKQEIKYPIDTLTYTDFTDEFLDTVKLVTFSTINNYSMIGVNYGTNLTSMTFNPSHQQMMTWQPGYYSIMFVHYEKMFDYIPYFGFKAGIEYSKEGYQFKPNKKTGQVFNFWVEKSNQIKMKVVEIPLLAEIHYDTRLFKLFADFGFYGGYRLSVERFGNNVEEDYRYNFYPTDHRLDYGLQGGLGFGFVVAPLEFHFGASLRYGWSTLFDANTTFTEDSEYAYLNKYYYRFAYPFDIMFTGGVYLHLSKRNGRTTTFLKKAAKDYVYGTSEQ